MDLWPESVRGMGRPVLERTGCSSPSNSLQHLWVRFQGTEGDHPTRVMNIAVAIAGQMGLPQEELDRISLASRAHDIGKIEVPESILRKPGSLTEDEFSHIRRHPVKSERILASMIRDQNALAMVRHHHERYDGTGYPDSLQGYDIPLGARVLAVADAYDAMVSQRPYRSTLSDAQARGELQRERGSQFDPVVVDAFMSCDTAFLFNGWACVTVRKAGSRGSGTV